MRRSMLPFVMTIASLACATATSPVRAAANGWTIILSNCR